MLSKCVKSRASFIVKKINRYYHTFPGFYLKNIELGELGPINSSRSLRIAFEYFSDIMIYWMSFDDTDESIHSINSNKYNKFIKTSPCPALIVLGCMYFCIVRKILWRIQYFCFDLYMFYSICMYIFSHNLWISSINI